MGGMTKGDYQEQQQMVIEPLAPPSGGDDNTLFLWMSGVIVPIVIAAIGWHLNRKREEKSVGDAVEVQARAMAEAISRQMTHLEKRVSKMYSDYRGR